MFGKVESIVLRRAPKTCRRVRALGQSERMGGESNADADFEALTLVAILIDFSATEISILTWTAVANLAQPPWVRIFRPRLSSGLLNHVFSCDLEFRGRSMCVSILSPESGTGTSLRRSRISLFAAYYGPSMTFCRSRMLPGQGYD